MQPILFPPQAQEQRLSLKREALNPQGRSIQTTMLSSARNLLPGGNQYRSRISKFGLPCGRMNFMSSEEAAMGKIKPTGLSRTPDIGYFMRTFGH
jgi:hypothetical protein